METLDPRIPEALARPEGHPEDPDAGQGVEHVQTHISHVFLTKRRVYKLRKSVDLGFLDFSSRAERNADSARELTLNRRLAPDVYLGVAPVLERAQGWAVGAIGESPIGEQVEHCVVMRRLPPGGDALARLVAGDLTAAEMDVVARTVARFHDAHGLGVPAPFRSDEWMDRVLSPVQDCVAALAMAGIDDAPPERTAALARLVDARFRDAAPRLEERRRAGFAVDGHGDLHLAHVWFEPDRAEPAIIDCIEFSERLRRIDAASEVAFLAMDLAYRDRADLAARFLSTYAVERDDFGLYGVVDAYQAYRALVRAKVAAIAAAESDVPAPQRREAGRSASRHLGVAEAFLAEPGTGTLILVSGTVGSGKSSAARVVADALGGAIVSSDRIRKRMAGLAATERGGAAQGLYDEAVSDAVYDGLLIRAAAVAASGRVAVLDATWSLAIRRDAALRFADAHGWKALLIETRCAENVVLRRLERRSREGRDPSDAGPERLEASRSAYQPPQEWPEARRIVVDTDVDAWPAALAERLSGFVSS
jgi:aminoglycoside phosphotransferase family enzyme/predicted kinase